MSTAISTVLTVDDDPIFLELIKATLAQRRVECIYQASNEDEAITILNSQPGIDLIVSDLLMPKPDGVGLMRHMKNSGCRVPLIIVSGAMEPTRAAVETLASAYQLNFLCSFSKPLKFDHFESALALAGFHFSEEEA